MYRCEYVLYGCNMMKCIGDNDDDNEDDASNTNQM